MPLKSSKNHELIWVDLLKGIPGSSWIEIFSILYNKNHGYSNYRKCKQRNHSVIREDVFKDERVSQYLALEGENKKKVVRVLDEMCHLLQTQSNPTRKLKFGGFPFLKCITNVYSNIYVFNHLFPLENENQLGHDLFKEQYLQMSKQLPIVILPTHRSYMDFLIITYIMFNHELPLPCVAAGDNFKAMGKYLCDYLKATGAFLIRRNAQNKKDIEANNYYDILRAYVHTILDGGENPLEFFMEGTRTRTGQVLHPKTGLLSMVVDMYLDKLIEDVYIMPVSINYQRPVEEQLYIAETTPQVNKKKPKESAKNLIAAFNTVMKNKYGKVYVRFIEPFKLSEYFNFWRSRTSEKYSLEGDNRGGVLQELTTSLANTVCLAQANHNILMPFNLMAFSIIFRSFLGHNKPQRTSSNGLPTNANGFSQNELGESEERKIKLELVMRDFGTIESMLILSQTQFVPGWTSHLSVLDEFKIGRDGIIRASSDRRCIEFNYNAVTFHTLQYYSNQVMQMLLPLAICCLLRGSKQGEKLNGSTYEKFKGIRYLLSREFLLDELSVRDEFENSINVIDGKGETSKLAEDAKEILIEHLIYFIRSYLTFLHYLRDREIFDRSEFYEYLSSRGVKKSEGGETIWQNDFISKDMLKSMVGLVAEMKICVKNESNESARSSNSKPRGEERYSVNGGEKLVKLIESFQEMLSMQKGT